MTRIGAKVRTVPTPLMSPSADRFSCWTATKTAERREWVALDEVLVELPDKLATEPDYVTLSGSGKPLLFSRLDELIAGIRQLTDTPIAVLNNGSLLWDSHVRRQIAGADLVIPLLDAGDQAKFSAVNRPHPDISFVRMLAGLIPFREGFAGQYWLEVFILGGYTALPAKARKIAERVRPIRPGRVQLNTVTRPPAEDFAQEVPQEHLEELAAHFEPQTEVVADFRGTQELPEFRASREAVLDLLSRRPCTVEDIAAGLGLHRNDVVKHIGELDAEGLLSKRRSGGRL